MMKTLSRFLAVFAAFALAAFALGARAQDAAEPTVAQIYQAANAGKLDQADAMIAQVIKAHPSSAKAHYVKAEVSAREGKLDVAREELATAEKLAPGLPFAKPEAVQSLRNLLSTAVARKSSTQPVTRQMGAPADQGPVTTSAAAPSHRSFPWGTAAVVIAIVALGAMLLRRRTVAPANGYDGGAYGAQPGYAPGAYPAGPGAVAPGYGPGYGPGPGYPPQQPSMGSTIARGVGTGLAMGAGMVAAEEIGHRMFGRDGQSHAGNFDAGTNANTPSLDQLDDGMRRNLNSDMGGNDFGIADGGGNWDDAGGGGDLGGGGDWDS